jgi:methionine sulfoxide reductase heme-binding subunit
MWRLPIAYLVLVGGLCAALVSTLEPGTAEVRAVVRATAFTSAVAFLPAFTASALQRLWPGGVSRWLMANRRYLGLSVAASHFWHLVALVTLAVLLPTFVAGIPMATLVFGGAGFVLLGLMAATSNDASQRTLGRAWGWLHTLGVYVLWLDFTVTYAGPAVRSAFHAVMTLVFLAAAGLRAAAWSARRSAAGRV